MFFTGEWAEIALRLITAMFAWNNESRNQQDYKPDRNTQGGTYNQ